MPLVLKDRVKETTTTTSTGAYTLAGAVTGYQSFSVIGDGNTTYYAVTNGTDWEVGIGTYTASGTTLSRDTILESSNSGNAVNWSAGTKDIFCTYPAEKSVNLDAAGDVSGYDIENSPIGANTPAAATFTTLTANSTSEFGRSSANYVRAVGAAASNGPVISSQGSDTNIDLNLTTKGTGAVVMNTGGGVQFKVVNTNTAVNYFQANGGATGVQPGFSATGTDTNISSAFTTKGTGAHFFSTNSFGQTQFVISHTASAVNYVQVTGAATGGQPNITVQGSDSAIGLTYRTKGNFNHQFQNGSFQIGFEVAPVGSGANYVRATSAIAGAAPVLSAQGSDTNIDLNLTTKGTGAVNLNTGGGTQVKVLDVVSADNPWLITGGRSGVQGNRITGLAPVIQSTDGASIGFRTNAGTSGGLGTEQLRVTHTASAVNYVQVTGAATGGYPSISAQGSDSAVGIHYDSKSFAYHGFRTSSTLFQFLINHTASAVNYATVTGAATGNGPRFSVAGSDTNIDLALTPKGTGRVTTAAAIVATGGISGGTF